jgi:hypothetical protein
VIYPDDQLPTLTSYPWHLTDEARVRSELAKLQQDDLFVSLVLWDVDNEPPLEVCLMMAREGMDKVLIVATRGDFPAAAPTAWSAPFVQMKPDENIYDVFEDLWAKAEPVADPPGWKWTPDKTILDYVHVIEKSLGITVKPTLKSQPQPADAEEEHS